MKKLTTSPDFFIRSPETAEEIEQSFRLNAEAFRPDEDTDLVVSRRRRMIELDPDFQMIHLRCAFFGKTYVGGYLIQERLLCIESSRLRIGCIGGVVTDPDYRHIGIATALMQDALAFAQERQYSILLLHGIPDFYQQHGFIDVMEDMPLHTIERSFIPDQPSERYVVREAESSDAATLLALYKEHYQASMCTFAPTRTVARQIHYLENWFEEHLPLMAFNEDGGPEGYAIMLKGQRQNEVYEVAANTWPAILALLHHQKTLQVGELSLQTDLYWPLPLSDSTYYFLSDHLPIRSVLESYPDGGWMARMVSFSAAVKPLLPLWRDRWQMHHIQWKGSFVLVVDEEKCILEFSPTTLRQVDQFSEVEQEVRLSQQVFIQLVFGFRSVSWAAMQAGQSVPDELISILDVLFPHKISWIAGSDYF